MGTNPRGCIEPLMYTEELPPHDEDAENGVLGSLLIDGQSTPRVTHILAPEDFLPRHNQFVFEAVKAVYDRGDDVHQISVADELSRRDRLEDCGGLPYLSRLITETPTSAYVDSYAGLVKTKSIQRQLIKAGSLISEVGFRGEDVADEMLRRSDGFLAAVHRARPASAPAALSEAVERFIDQAPRDGRPSGVSTGFADLDIFLGGLFGGNVVVLAATTGVGKSALAKDIAINVAGQKDRDGRPRRVLFFSIEMSETENVARLLARLSGVSLNRVLVGPWDDAQTDKIMQAAGDLAELPMHVADTRQRTVAAIRSEAKLLQQERGLDLVVVDYLQLVAPSDPRQNRVQQVTEVTHGLKAMALSLNLPILALAQLSRAGDARAVKEPILSDLRESGSIEQDADAVLFLHRADPGVSDQVDVILAKHRNGPTGRFKLAFAKATTTFTDMRLAKSGARD